MREQRRRPGEHDVADVVDEEDRIDLGGRHSSTKRPSQKMRAPSATRRRLAAA